MFTANILTIKIIHITYLLLVIRSVIDKYVAGIVMDRLIAFGLFWVWKDSIIIRW